MSIMLATPVIRLDASVRSRHELKTSSILLISVAITLAMVLLMYAGLAYTEGTMKQYSSCRDKIAGYEQSGAYINPDQFKLALSYCDVI